MKIATTKERILQYIDYKQISKQKFFAETDLKRGFLDADKLQTSIPDTFIATIIAKYPEINLEWLITGTGTMLKSEVPAQSAGPTNKDIIDKMCELSAENALLKKEISELKRGDVRGAVAKCAAVG